MAYVKDQKVVITANKDITIPKETRVKKENPDGTGTTNYWFKATVKGVPETELEGTEEALPTPMGSDYDLQKDQTVNFGHCRGKVAAVNGTNYDVHVERFLPFADDVDP